ncbi:IS66 family transposase zinc-finger binding domain-containing protein [Limosilactobacillus reuteri]|nr:IS66 family transposase zinc-finger binding domain-containing protein [Limosilactobacillus reuteri]
MSLKDTNCPHCHQLMKRIGQHIYSREARLKPAELYCVNLIQETYKCDECINSNGSLVARCPKVFYRIVTFRVLF